MFESLKTFPFDINEYSPSLRRYGIGFPHTEETKQSISEMKSGIKQTPEHIQKRVSSVTGFKQSEHQKKVATETFSAEWIVTSPNGESFKIKNLRSFCRENNLDQGNLSRGSHKGWKSVKLET